MPIVFLTPENKTEFLERLGKIQADTPRQWGKMDAHRMLAHLRISYEVSTGEAQIPDGGNFFIRTVGRFVAFHTPLPWPRGKLATLPGYLPEPEGSFEEEKERLIAAINRFDEAATKEPGKEVQHPAFGPRALSYWRRVQGMHTNHHLCQFGV